MKLRVLPASALLATLLLLAPASVGPLRAAERPSPDSVERNARTTHPAGDSERNGTAATAAVHRSSGSRKTAAVAVAALLERIAPGASKQFVLEQTAAERDFFELDQRGRKVVVRGNNSVSIAAGIHWYLKYYAGIHLAWDCMQARLPEVLPPVPVRERHEAQVLHRYGYNYCTFSYTMAFWDWERWEREIDWMALHGINLPLMAVGMEAVWRDVLRGLGYDDAAVGRFVAGPAFQAWWLMDNLEGWGGPCPASWYDDRAELARKILARMRELGIEPVLPGYSGKVPSDAKERLGLAVSDPGRWCGYPRPAFLQPADPRFGEIAARYYAALERHCGKARYYSCDPFHEGGSTAGVDLPTAGRAILGAMKQASPDAVWVLQAWQANPRPAMIDSLPARDVLVLDLNSESRPQWGEPASEWYRPAGYGPHPWVYCMLLNFGGNVGLYGKMDYVVEGWYDAQEHPRAGQTLAGAGFTPEGIENNPVMFELLTELPWRAERFTREAWLPGYLRARYGRADADVEAAWELLANSVYACPKSSTQEGTHESVFCARPVLDFTQTSAFAATSDYYDPQQVVRAARRMLAAAERLRGCDHFEYDLTDIVRQAVAEAGRLQQKAVAAAYRAGDREAFAAASQRFLRLILLQDRLLGTRSEFRVGRWIASARALGHTEAEKALLEWNARVQITTWGDRNAADGGGLRDYAHKEWNGILRDLYHTRWKLWFELLQRRMEGEKVPDIDFYPIEEAWAKASNPYPAAPSGDCIATAREVFAEVFGD